MERNKTSSAPQQASNYDELSMGHTLLFADNLKELKNLGKQLYSAAEYFELSYSRVEHKQFVVENVKDYIANAIVNTVDHLGSVACKVTNLLDDKVDEFSGTDLHFSCIEQRLRSYKDFTNRSGISQHSLLIKTPKYHKKYVIPGGKKDVRATRFEPHSSSFRKGHSSLLPSSGPETFSFPNIVSDKGLATTDSPEYVQLKRSETTLIRNSMIPNYSNTKQPNLELRRSASVSTIHGGRNMTREIQPYSKKSLPLFKALFTMLKQKKDGKLHK